LPLWRPAAGLIRQLRFPGKMALMSLGFLIPIIWLLWSAVGKELADIDVARQELAGVRYANAIYPALTWGASGVSRHAMSRSVKNPSSCRKRVRHLMQP